MPEDYFYFDQDDNVIFRPTGDCVDNSGVMLDSTVERLNEILGKMVVITPTQFNDLCESDQWLTCLEDAGVDNWSGVDYARELLDEMNNQDD